MRTTGDATCSPQHVVSKCVAVGGVKWNPSFQDSSAPGWAGAAVGAGHIRQDDLPSHWWVSMPRPGSLCVCLHMQECSHIYGGSCIPRPGCACCAKECTLHKGMHVHGHALEAAPSQGFPGHVWTCRYWYLWYPHTAAGGPLFTVTMETGGNPRPASRELEVLGLRAGWVFPDRQIGGCLSRGFGALGASGVPGRPSFL